MAFRKYANALVSQKDIHFDQWMDELRKNASDVIPEEKIIRTAKEVLIRCDPKQFLLSHSTIVASVDTYSPKNARSGRGFDERGLEIDTRFTDYMIKPECNDIINNNGDAWERSLLMSSYKTFVGAPNYLEHIQIPDLSKGFLVDAIARDVGHSCYIDILVATDRKHNKLINDILSGEMHAMSMGCISAFTICSRCGNVAVDDSQLCSHILYDGKLSNFHDDNGNEHKLGELIGHVTVPNSNQFIEASWVRNPAFRGAERRNILNVDKIVGNPSFAAKLSRSADIYEIRSTNEMNFDIPSRAASTKLKNYKIAADDEELMDDVESDDTESDDTGSDDTGSDDTEPQAAESKSDPKSKIKELADKAQEQILEMVVKNLGEVLKPDAEDVGSVVPPMDLNNNVISASFTNKLKETFHGHNKLVKWASHIYSSSQKDKRFLSSLTPQDLIKFSWVVDIVGSKKYSSDLYQAVMVAGPIKDYPSKNSYIAACNLHLKRDLSKSEKIFLVKKGRIASISNKF